jgi:DNA mismatch repair protein MutS
LASKDKEVKETPLMKQYNEIKRKYPDACLLFRVGDFTKHLRRCCQGFKNIGNNPDKAWCRFCNRDGIAGFPHHSINTYLPKLVKAGLRRHL